MMQVIKKWGLLLFVALLCFGMAVQNPTAVQAKTSKKKTEATTAKEKSTKKTTESTTAKKTSTKKTEESTTAKKTTTKTASKEETIAEIMASNPEDAETPNTKKPSVSKTTYKKQFTYSDGFSLSGIFGTESMYFQIPDYWDSQYAYAKIEFSLSQLITDVPASMTFLVNNVPVYSCKMDYELGKNQSVYFQIPVDLLNEGYNSFDLTGYVRIYDEEGCIDDLSGANWVYINEDSCVEVGYELLSDEQKISYYPYPFISTVEENGASTQVLVSDAVKEEELQAALLLRADLAAETDTDDQIFLGTYSNQKSGDDEKTILVASWDNLPDQYKKKLTDVDEDALGKSALVQFLKEDGKPVLLITSKKDSCLMEAAMMLVDEDRASQEKSSTAYVKEGSAQLVMDSETTSDMIAGRYTVEQIMDSGVTFTGPFHQTADIFLPFSGGYVLSSSSKVSLNFRYSKNLDFKRSMITVYWGDVPVASKKLTEDNADGDELSFTMPTDVIGTSATKISIAFDLELPDLFCTPRMDEMPWAYVSGDSSLYLPLGVSGTLSFDLRPYPFEVSSQFNDLLVVIPDEPSKVELDTLGQMVALYGESVTSYGSLDVVRAGDFNEKDADAHIMTVGNYEDNALIAKLNDSLSFQYEEDGSQFLSNEQLVLSDSYARNIVTMQMLHSPYGEDRGILVAAGINDETLSYLRDYLTLDKNIWKLEGDTVLIDEDGELDTFTFLENDTKQNKPALKQFVEENQDSLLFAMVATSAMLLLLLAVILILIRMYARGKKK
jgi:hypothetical protein